MTDVFELLPRLRGMAVACLFLAAPASIAAPTLNDIQTRWDATNFTLTAKAQTEAFEELQVISEAFTDANPEQVEGWIWRGIIDSSFAGAKGGLGALGLAKSARKHFEKAIDMDGDAMQGSAYSSLGTLYYSVPGWPVGFGNDKKAEEMLQQGLSLNPDGIESNYFYAQFLEEQKKPAEALAHYQKALNAPPRPGRQVADDGRRAQIEAAIAALDK